MGRTEQNAALVICLTAVLKRLDEMARLIGAGPARSLTGDNQLSLMSHEDQVKTHVYTAPFKVRDVPPAIPNLHVNAHWASRRF
jgi:hypothetical protein